jgi:hypothetical protein
VEGCPSSPRHCRARPYAGRAAHWKLGDWKRTDAGFETYFGTVIGVPVVAVVNSPARSWRLDAVVDNAQIAATTPAQ